MNADNKDSSKNIYLSSYPSAQALEVKETLYNLYYLSDQHHKLTDCPDAADIILIGQPGNELKGSDYIREIKENNFLELYSEKCFAVSLFRANHFFLTQGIYESGINSFLLRNRIQSGCYVPRSFNPEIEKILRDEKSNESSGKTYLFSFIGRNSHQIRNKLFSMKFSREDVHIENSSDFNVWDSKIDNAHWRFRYYKDVLLKSKFSLCPRGYGPGSIRLFESMSLGVSPVIISDEWTLPHGPDWESFSIIIKSRDLVRLESIISEYEESYAMMGKEAEKAYKKYFSDEEYFNYIVSECSRIENNPKFPEKFHWKFRSVYIRYYIVAYWLRSQKKELNNYTDLILTKMKKLLKWI